MIGKEVTHVYDFTPTQAVFRHKIITALDTFATHSHSIHSQIVHITCRSSLS